MNSIKSFTGSVLEALASKERDKVVAFIIKLRPDQFWIDLWKKHGNLLDWPTTILNAILQDTKSVPEPIRDFVMNSSEDLLDAIRNLAEGKTSNENNPTPASPSTPATVIGPVSSIKNGMLKIGDIDTVNNFIKAVKDTGRGDEILNLSGEEAFIDEVINKILELKDDNTNLKQFAETILGKKKDQARLAIASLIKVSQHNLVYSVYDAAAKEKQKTFLAHIDHLGNANDYLTKLEALTDVQIQKELNEVYLHSPAGDIAKIKTIAKRNGRKISRETIVVGRKVWGWLEPKIFLLALSILMAAAAVLTGLFFGKPILIGAGVLVGLMIAVGAWLSSGVFPLASLILTKQVFPDIIKKAAFWVAIGGGYAMLLRGIIHGPEAIIALTVVLVVTALVMQITKFKTDKVYWINAGILIALFSLTYVFPRNYEVICRSVSKGDKLWVADKSVRANMTDVKATIREAYTKKFINNVYELQGDSTLKITRDIHLVKGLGVRYYDFNGEVKVSKNGIPYVEIGIADSFNEYQEDGPKYCVEANLIEVNQGKGLLSFIPIGKRDLGVETSIDGDYSVKKWAEGTKELWKVTSKTNNPFKVENLPVGKKSFKIIGGNYKYSFDNQNWGVIRPNELRDTESSVWINLASGQSVEIMFL